MPTLWEDELAEFVARATRGLTSDPELRMDAARELRSHLEDTVAQRHATGASADEAQTHALKAFGDPDEVSQALRAANLRRMRMRSVLKWAARLTLGPAAAVVMLALLLYAGESVTGMGYSEHASTLQQWLAKRAEKRSMRTDLSAEERYLLCAQPKEMAAKYPGHPVYCAAYARQCLNEKQQKSAAKLMGLLDRGEKLEPENAFYNYMKAAILLEAGAQFGEDVTRVYTMTQRGKILKKQAQTLAVRDRELIARAMRELRTGNAKPGYNSHTLDSFMAQQRLWRKPETLREEVARVLRMAETPVPDLPRLLRLVRGIVAYAALLAGEGKSEAARDALQAAHMATLKLGASAVTLIELLVAERAYLHSLHEAAFVHDTLEDSEAAQRCRADAESAQAHFAAAAHGGPLQFSPEELKKEGAFFFNWAIPVPVNRNRELLRAWRMSERVVFERAALTGMLLFAFAGLVCLAVRLCWSLVAHGGREDRPKLLFIGWRRLLLLLAWSVIIPLGGYYVWTRLMPFGGTRFGTRYCADRLVLEMVIFGMALPAISLVTGFHAIRARCAAAGIAVPGSDAFRPGTAWRVAGVLAGAAVLGYAMAWERPGCRGRAGYGLAALLVGMGVVWLVLSSRKLARTPRELDVFRKTFARSFAPILAAVIVLAGATGHIALKVAERQYIAVTQSPGWRLSSDEIEMTGYDKLQQAFVEQHRAAMAQPREGRCGKALRAPQRSMAMN